MSYMDMIFPERMKATLNFSEPYSSIYLVLEEMFPNSKWIVRFDFMRNILIDSVGEIFALRIDPADFGKGYLINGRIVSEVCFFNKDVQYDIQRLYYLILGEKELTSERLEKMFEI